MFMMGTSALDIRELYVKVCIRSWENRLFKIAVLVTEMVSPTIKTQLQIALRPTDCSQVMQLFQEWIAKRQFDWIDIVFKETIGRPMVGVNILNKKAVRYAVDPSYSVKWSLTWTGNQYHIQHTDTHNQPHDHYGLLDS